MTISYSNWIDAVLTINSTISEAIQSLNRSSLKIVLVVGKNNQLIGTVTDGDIRRAILMGKEITNNIGDIVQKKPVISSPQMSRNEIIDLMIANKVFQVPIVDKGGEVIGLNLWSDLVAANNIPNYFVIMAGGKGTRLHPFTTNIPKAMVKIGGKPMIELIIEKARAEGFVNFFISLNHLGDIIQNYFGDGTSFGVNIRYVKESAPLGTAGALSLIDVSNISDSIVVTNCDVIADINYAGLLDFHKVNSAHATMGVKIFEWENPYGVVRLNDLAILGIDEKPIQSFVINAGVYVLEPEILKKFFLLTEKNDMTDLFRKFLRESLSVVAYPIHENWCDVGRPEDLNKLLISKSN